MKLTITVFGLIIIFVCSCSKNDISKETFGILSLGLKADESWMADSVSKKLKEQYGANIVILSPGKLPPEAWYAPRKRYKASILLDYLSKIKPDSINRILALTSADISISTKEHKDWGIMGLAKTPGSVCVVSTFRLGKKQQLSKQRLYKVCTHELGHTFGLPHCDRDLKCVMNDAEGSIKTIDRCDNNYCIACKKDLE